MTAPIAIIRALPIKSIAAPSNIRISNGHDKDSLTQLAASIKTHGLIQPIVVRPSEEGEGTEYTIVAGRRRLAASKLAGLDTIASIVSETDEAKAYELEAAENIQREQMTLADTARAVRTFMLIYDNAKKVGEILNKSPAWVSKHLTITSAQFPTTIAELLDRGVVQDLETLLLLAQIAKMPASNDRALSTLTRMLRIAHAGDMNRQIARDALAALKAPASAAPAPVTTTTTHTKAHHQTALELAPVDPAKTFNVQLPIDCLADLETLGGAEWIVARIKEHFTFRDGAK
jgi:ParB/RepB/Spo0J family partition protein